jgi:membrane protein
VTSDDQPPASTPDPRPVGRVARARSTAERYAVRLERTVLGRLWSRLLEMEFVDRAVALAAKAFVSFFPLLVVFSALLPASGRQEVVTALAARLGLSGDAFDIVRQAFNAPDATRAATGVLGVAVTVAFAVSFTTALQRTYLRAWRRPPGGGMRNKGRGLVWLGGIFGLLSFLSIVRSFTGSTGSWALGIVVSVGLWWWTAHIMLRGEVRWRPLLPTAAVTGVGVWLYTLAANVWMPANVANNFVQFGAFGIALSFVTWFTGMSFIIVAAAAVAPSLADGDDVVGRWVRGGRSDALTPGAPPPLPGPARPVRLSDAFGRGEHGSGVDRTSSSGDEI